MMFGLESKDAMLVILGLVYGIYCAWAKYCEQRWPTPPECDCESLKTASRGEEK